MFADPRVQDWPLMAAPGPTYALVALYLLIVYLGPRLMRHRRALDLKAVIAPYNFALVFLNLYMCYEVRATVTCATRYVPPLHVLRGTSHLYMCYEVRVTSIMPCYVHIM